MDRRQFLKVATGSAVTWGVSAAAWARDSAPGNQGQDLRLGIDCYTIRDFNWKAFQLLDYAASVGADAIQVNLGDLESREDDYLRAVKEHADRVGVAIEPGINAICPLSGRWSDKRQGTPTDHLLLGLRLARALGANAVKCYMGYAGDRRGATPIPTMIESSIEAFVGRFRELCPKAPLLLEILTGSPPQVLPYLEPAFWQAFPGMPAADFARFVALARTGQPFSGSMLIAAGNQQPAEYAAALKQQQRIDLERSLEYAKETLDVGVNWRQRDTDSQ